MIYSYALFSLIFPWSSVLGELVFCLLPLSSKESLGNKVCVSCWTLQSVLVCQSLRWGSLSSLLGGICQGAEEAGRLGKESVSVDSGPTGCSEGCCRSITSPRAVRLSWATGITREKGATPTFSEREIAGQGWFSNPQELPVELPGEPLVRKWSRDRSLPRCCQWDSFVYLFYCSYWGIYFWTPPPPKKKTERKKKKAVCKTKYL